MSRGNEDQFQHILGALAKNCRAYEAKEIKHIQYVDQVDAIFSGYGWSKSEFYKELNERLGIQTNETRKKKTSAVPLKQQKKLVKS